jgi:hypothetical protein
MHRMVVRGYEPGIRENHRTHVTRSWRREARSRPRGLACGRGLGENAHNAIEPEGGTV